MLKYLFFILFFLSACGSEPIPPAGEISADNIYTNERLQLRFTLPEENWRFYSAQEIALNRVLAQNTDSPVTIDFFARQTENGSTIALTFKRVAGDFDVLAYLADCCANDAHNFVTRCEIVAPTPLAGISWYTKHTFIYAPHPIAVEIHLSAIIDGYLVCLNFFADDLAEFEQMKQWFAWARQR